MSRKQIMANTNLQVAALNVHENYQKHSNVLNTVKKCFVLVDTLDKAWKEIRCPTADMWRSVPQSTFIQKRHLNHTNTHTYNMPTPPHRQLLIKIHLRD